MQEQVFYGVKGYEQAVAFEQARRAEGHQTALIGHPLYATQLVRYWK